MKNQIIKQENEIVIPLVLPKEKYELAKSIAAKGATDAEFELLVHMANKYNLDPLAKQIWCIKRNPASPALIMTSRDGYLEIAHKSGQFDGIEHGTIDDEKGLPIKAWCTVYRKDMSHPFKAEVKYREYVQASPTWQKYPSAMLIKVAEVFALKRAFSISGMVTTEEISETEDESPKQVYSKETPKLNGEKIIVETKFVSDLAEPAKKEKSLADELMEEDDREELLASLSEWISIASETLNKSTEELLAKLAIKYGDIDKLDNAGLQTIVTMLQTQYGKEEE